MKAITYETRGSPHLLKMEEIERPIPGKDQVLINVRAASLNPVDYHLMREAHARRMLSALTKGMLNRPGLDVAGVVEVAGRNVTGFKPGDAVFGVCGGAFAEYACATPRTLARKPDNVSFEQAASVPLAGLTALQALRDKGRLKASQKVLINGASGGVGTFAVQIARWLGGEVTGVCSGRNIDLVRGIGADHVIDYTRDDFTKASERYDLIFDLVMNHPFRELRCVMTPKGTYIGAGMMGRKVSMLGMTAGEMKVFVATWFASQKGALLLTKFSSRDLGLLADLVQTGKIKPVIDRSYALPEAETALEYLEGGHARGKVVITMG